MTVDRVLAIVGIIIGVPAFLALFIQSAHKREAILSLIIIALVVGFRMLLTYKRRRPQFSIRSVKKHFVIHDAAGATASFEGTRKMRANFKGATEFWYRNIVQDGSIANIKIDGKNPDVTETVCGTTHICKRFARPLEEGEEFETSFSYDLANSFTNPKREGVIHNNGFRTDEVELTVDLPRPCTRAEFRRTFVGDEGELLPSPTLSNGNLRITAKVKKPLIGASYHVEWDW